MQFIVRPERNAKKGYCLCGSECESYCGNLCRLCASQGEGCWPMLLH